MFCASGTVALIAFEFINKAECHGPVKEFWLELIDSFKNSAGVSSVKSGTDCEDSYLQFLIVVSTPNDVPTMQTTDSGNEWENDGGKYTTNVASRPQLSTAELGDLVEKLMAASYINHYLLFPPRITITNLSGPMQMLEEDCTLDLHVVALLGEGNKKENEKSLTLPHAEDYIRLVHSTKTDNKVKAVLISESDLKLDIKKSSQRVFVLLVILESSVRRGNEFSTERPHIDKETFIKAFFKDTNAMTLDLNRILLSSVSSLDLTKPRKEFQPMGNMERGRFCENASATLLILDFSHSYFRNGRLEGIADDQLSDIVKGIEDRTKGNVAIRSSQDLDDNRRLVLLISWKWSHQYSNPDDGILVAELNMFRESTFQELPIHFEPLRSFLRSHPQIYNFSNYSQVVTHGSRSCDLHLIRETEKQQGVWIPLCRDWYEPVCGGVPGDIGPWYIGSADAIQIDTISGQRFPTTAAFFYWVGKTWSAQTDTAKRFKDPRQPSYKPTYQGDIPPRVGDNEYVEKLLGPLKSLESQGASVQMLRLRFEIYTSSRDRRESNSKKKKKACVIL
jgi:hypothetical protein